MPYFDVIVSDITLSQQKQTEYKVYIRFSFDNYVPYLHSIMTCAIILSQEISKGNVFIRCSLIHNVPNYYLLFQSFLIFLILSKITKHNNPNFLCRQEKNYYIDFISSIVSIIFVSYLIGLSINFVSNVVKI